MRDSTHFGEIDRITIRKGEYDFILPLCYYESAAFGVAAAADRSFVASLISSPRLTPIALPAGRIPIIIAAIEHRDSDLGAFNELIVAVPVRLGRAGLFDRAAIWRWFDLSFYVIHRITGDARAAAAYSEIFNFPVTRAPVYIEHRAQSDVCHASIDDDLAIVMETPRKEGPLKLDTRVDVFSVRSDRLLRSEIAGNFYGIGSSLGFRSRIEFGSRNFFSRDIKDLKLGRILAGWHIPHAVFLMTHPIESLPIGAFR